MKIKSLALGAAAIAAATGAQAADLGAPVEPVDYVRICDAYGAGFWFIPGTETCLRVAGRVRVEYRFAGTESANGGFTGSVGNRTQASNRTYFRARAYLYMDARRNTDFGLLRTYTEMWFTSDTGQGTGAGTTMWRAFIQWGGLTAGRVQSFFDFYSGGYDSMWDITGASDTTTTVLAYTFAFGNGITATLSLEDGVNRRAGAIGVGSVLAAANTVANRAVAYGGHYWPDVVANINVTQAWGAAQIMGAIHGIETNTSIIPALGTTQDKEIGWAIGAGVQINLAQFLMGGTFSLQASYADGAGVYVSPVAAFSDFYANGQQTAGTKLRIATTKVWGVAAGLTLNVAPQWTLDIHAGYSGWDAPMNWDATMWTAEVGLAWSPVSGLVFALVGEYGDVDYDATATAAGFVDTNELAGFFRIQSSY